MILISLAVSFSLRERLSGDHYAILTWFFSRKPFSEFSLDDEVVGRLKKLGFTTSFEIQDKTLPLTLEGRLAVAHNYMLLQ